MPLTLTNLWGRAHVFYRFNFCRLGEDMPHALLRMVRSGHFYPAGTWVIPSQGKGMVRSCANACWRMLTDPEQTSMADIAAVFFEDCSERYYMHVTDPLSPNKVANVRCDESPSPGVKKVHYEDAVNHIDFTSHSAGGIRVKT